MSPQSPPDGFDGGFEPMYDSVQAFPDYYDVANLGYPYGAPRYPAMAALPPPPYAQVYPAPGYPVEYYVTRKSPVVALIASLVVPGLGTIINGEGAKGILILVLYGFAVLMSMVLIGLPFALAIWIWGMVDGYQGAVHHNRRYGLY